MHEWVFIQEYASTYVNVDSMCGDKAAAQKYVAEWPHNWKPTIVRCYEVDQYGSYGQASIYSFDELSSKE